MTSCVPCGRPQKRVTGVFGYLVRFILLTATRRTEAAHMADGELSGADWIIPGSRYKTKLDHVIPLSAAAREVLASIPRIKGVKYVFSTGDNLIAKKVIGKKRSRAAAGRSAASRNSKPTSMRNAESLAGRCMICAAPAVRLMSRAGSMRTLPSAALATSSAVFAAPMIGTPITMRRKRPLKRLPRRSIASSTRRKTLFPSGARRFRPRAG